MFQDNERNRLSGRIARYAKVGGSFGGIALQAGVTKLAGRDLFSPENAKELARVLGSLKGPMVKAAQIAAMVPDLLPEDIANELRQLQSQAPAMGWLFVKRRMRAELGDGWQEKFASFEQQACAAASLGQVHKATDHDGAALACKLQYPDMASAVEADVEQLKAMLGLVRRYHGIIDFSAVIEELRERLREELDYNQELKHIKLFKTMLEEVEGVHVPRPYPEFSTSRLLTMQWLEGEKLLDWLKTESSQDARNALAIKMFRIWYSPFYHYGIIHADPHFGNYSITSEGDLNLLDFGCIRVFSPEFVQGVIDLYHAVRDKDQALALKAYQAWGFDNPNQELVETLNIWSSFLFAPLLEDKVQLLQGGETTKRGQEAMGRVREKLHKLGGVKLPKPFIFMDRAAVGLGSVFTHLKAEVNWHQLFQDQIQGFCVDKLYEKQAKLLNKPQIEPL